MMEERYHGTTQNRFYPDMSNVNKNITVEAKLISPPTYLFKLVKGTILKLVLEHAVHVFCTKISFKKFLFENNFDL